MTITVLGSATSIATLNAEISSADALVANSGTYEIDFGSNISAADYTPINALNLASGVDLIINGEGYTLSGSISSSSTASLIQGFFVYSGEVTIENVTLAGLTAHGGWANYGGGGGAGLGGGVFVAGTANNAASPGTVTLNNVTFSQDYAIGGNANQGASSGASGGGGLGGAGANAGGGGIGNGNQLAGGAAGSGGGLASGAGAAGIAGIVIGAGSGGTGTNKTYTGAGGTRGGGGGGGSSTGTVAGNAGGGGGVPGSGSAAMNGSISGSSVVGGGAGGFGGGGGAALIKAGYSGTGGAGGFGGGGGGATSQTGGTQKGGAGGFGGGGGVGKTAGAGGFGGGAGSTVKGGGGLGAGGDIFVQQGGTLITINSTLGAGSVAGGTGANAGSGFGSSVFLQGSQSVEFAAEAGQTTMITGSIADQNGSASGYASYKGSLQIGDNSGVYTGIVDLTGANTFTGGVLLDSGTLELGGTKAAGTGAITFGSGSSLVLEIASTVLSNGTTLSNTIAAISKTDIIDFAGATWSASNSVSVNATTHVLTVTYGGSSTQSVVLSAALATGAAALVSADGNGGTDVSIESLNFSGATTTNTTDAVAVAPLSSISLYDYYSSVAETVTITLTSGGSATDADGTLSGAAWYSAGTYTLVGTPGAVTTALQALVFTPTQHQVSAGSTVTTTITLVATNTAYGEATTNSYSTVVATAVNDAPTISGTGSYTTNDETTVTPFASTTVADIDTSTTDIVTITLSGGDANGTLTGATWVSAGVYTLAGLPTAVTTSLQALVFTPKAHEVSPGSTVTTTITLVASQPGGSTTTSATTTSTTVVATAVNDAPTITGATAGHATTDEVTVTPLSAVVVADVDTGVTEIVTITLAGGDAQGTLSGATRISAGTYTVMGTPGAVTTALEALVFKPTAHEVGPGSVVTTTLTLVASQVAGGSTVSATNGTATVIATAVNDAPTIVGATTTAQAITDQATLTPLSSVTVGDVDTGVTETVTITLGGGSNANGTLTGATLISAGTYTLVGTPTAVTSALEALVFKPTAGQVGVGSTVTTTITVLASQVAGGSTRTATNTTTTVVATGTNAAPTISGATAGHGTTDELTLTPLSAVTITDTGTTEVVTITLSNGDSNGTLTGATRTAAGTYTISGTPTAVTAAVEALVFKPTAHEVGPGGTVTTTITVAASQIIGSSTASATNSTTTVIATAVNDAPTLTGATASHTTTDEVTVAPLSAVVVADVDTGVTEIVTISLGGGDAHGTLTGATWISAGTYSVVGTPGAVTTALEALVFKPTAHEVSPGSLVTTTITLIASQVAGGSTTSATNSTTTVIATAVNDAPTIGIGTAAQVTTDNATSTPLSTVTIADVDLSTTETVTITLTVSGAASVADGSLSGATSTGTGVYTIVGTPGAVTTALAALVFTPTAHQVVPGSTVTTGIKLVAVQVAGGTTTAATNSASTIVATAANDAPTITGATTSNITDATTTLKPLSAVTVTDADKSTTEIVTITLTVSGVASVADGSLSGATSTGTGVYTITGTPGAVTTALEALVFKPTNHQVAAGSTVTTGITLVAVQVAGGSTTSATNSASTVVATATNDAPTITVGTAAQTTTDNTTSTPLSTITVTDVDTSTTETLTITLTAGGAASDANGTLTGATHTGTGTYTLMGLPGALTTALAALVFTPTGHQVTPGSTVTTGVTLVATQIAGGTTVAATNTASTIVATAANDAPSITITTASQATTDESTNFKPLATASVADTDLSTTETVTITLTVNGTASVADGSVSGATSTTTGVYTITGTPVAVTTALEALVFTPTIHQVPAGSTVTTGIRLVAVQVAGGSTTSATNTSTTIVATATNDAPTITVGTTSHATTDNSTITAPANATVTDVDNSTTETLTITLTAGGLASNADGTLSGAAYTGLGTYTLVGLPGALTTALASLVFTPTGHQVTPGSTVTTGITLVATQVAGGTSTAATNTATILIVTAANDAPTIAGASAGHGTTDNITSTPLSTVTVSDTDLSTTETVTITLTVSGSASTADGSLTGAVSTTSGVYTLSGTPGAVTTALEALVFTPTGHQVSPGSTVTTGITLVAVQVAGGTTTSATSSTTTIIATAVNDAPSIAGATTSQTTDASTTLRPLATVTVADSDLSTTETVTLTLTAGGVASDGDGTLTGATRTGAGVYTIVGAPGAVTTALQAVIFTPTSHQVAPGSTVTTGITLVAVQVAGGSTTSATNTTTSVVATATNDAPTLTVGTAVHTTTDNTTSTPLATVTVTDVDLSTTETLIITLTASGSASDADGTLTGAAHTGTGTYTLIGLPGALTTALAALVFTPTDHQVTPGSTVTTGITLVATQTAGGTSVAATNTASTIVATAVNDAPTIAGTSTGQTTDESTTFRPLSATTVADVDLSTTEIVTITLTVGGAASVADGVLSGATSTASGVYTVVGTPGAVTTALQALIFTPTSHQVTPGSTVTTGITLVASQVAGGSTTSATNSAGTVVATAVNDAPTIAVYASQTDDESTTFKPLSAATVGDVDLSTTETVTITLTVGGAASVADGVLSGATSTASGVYTIVGTPGAVTTALQALNFTPTSHQVTPGSTVTTGITLVASQVAGGSTTSATNSTATVVATAVNDAPTITVYSSQTTDGSTIFQPLSAATIGDVDLSTTETVTITLTVGGAASVADGVLSGATSTASGVYTIVGAPGAVTTALQALIFTPTSHQVTPGSTVTTGITLVASQVAGGSTTSATNSTGTIVATAVNDAPTIAGATTGQTTDESTTFTPLSAATVADVDTGTTEIVTITLTVGGAASVADGVLSGATSTASGVYTIVGAPGAVTTALQSLIFTPTSHQVTPGSTVTTGITLVASQVAGGSTTSATNSTGMVVATAVNDAPTIAVYASQTDDESTTFKPLSAATVGDVDLSTTETVTITLTVGGAASVADGVLSGATSTSSGVYTIVGTPGAVTTALQALIFTPTSHQVTPGSTVTTGITLVASQVAGGSTTSATNSTATVVATAVNDAPTITVYSSQTTDGSTIFQPLSAATIGDVDLSTTETVTITLTVGGAASVADGSLSGATSTGTGVYTIVGAPGAVTTALQALIFTPTSHQVTPGSTVTTGITLVASQVAGGSTTSATNSAGTVVATAVNDAPTIAVYASQTDDESTTFKPLSAATVGDVDLSTTETVTITLTVGGAASVADGVLSGATSTSSGVYTIVGTPGAVTTALQALIFTPTSHQVTPGSTVTTGITLVASQVAGGSTTSATNSTATVVATAVNDAPTITVYSSQTTDGSTIFQPLSAATIGDVDLSTTETVTITLTVGGAASVADGVLSGATSTASGVYTIVGAPGAVTTALQALIFTPTSHQVTPGSTVTTGITLVASQVAGGSTTSATNSTGTIVATAVNDAPTIAGATTGQTTDESTTFTPLSAATVADVDTGTTEIVTITLTVGGAASIADGVLSGATSTGTGVYTIVGSPGAVTTALQALIFTPTSHQVTPGSTVTTGITLVARQVAGGSTTSATNSTGTIVATAVNDAPTIAVYASQTDDESTTFKPLSAATVGDVDLSTTETVTITLTVGGAASIADGVLSGATSTGTGVYTIVGAPGAVTTALQALIFTPTSHQVAPGSTVTTGITLVASQVAGGSTTSATNSTGMVVATAVNDAPTIAGTSTGQTTDESTTFTPLSATTVADVDLSTTETVTITLTVGGAASVADGVLSGATSTGTGVYTIVGAPGAVTTALQALIFTPTSHQVTPGSTVTTGITLVASQVAGGSTTSATNSTGMVVATAVNDAPTIAGATTGQTTDESTTFTPLSATTVADVDLSTTETVTITLTVGGAASVADGVLSGATSTSSGVYTIVGTPGAVTTALQALIFTPTSHQVTPGSTVTTGITLVASQVAGGSTTSATNSTATVVATAVNDAPTITVYSSQTTDESTIFQPLSAATIGDVDLSTTETVTITLTVGGAASVADGSLAGATSTGTGVYTIVGAPGAVTTALQALIFTPTSHQVAPGSTVTTGITLVASQVAGGSTTSATNSTGTIVATAVNDAPTIAGATTGQTTDESTTFTPLSAATVADVDTGTPRS